MGIDVGTALTIVAIIVSIMGSTWWLDKRNREALSELKTNVADNSKRLNEVERIQSEILTLTKGYNERFDRQEESSEKRFDRLDALQRDLFGEMNKLKGSVDVIVKVFTQRHTKDDAA